MRPWAGTCVVSIENMARLGNVLVVNFKLGQLHPASPPPRPSSLLAVIATLTQAGALPEPYIQIKRSQKVRRARMESSADAKYS